jgi:hypothetical protein
LIVLCINVSKFRTQRGRWRAVILPCIFNPTQEHFGKNQGHGAVAVPLI